MGRYIDYNELLIRYPLVDTWSDKPSHIESYMIYYAERMTDALLAPGFSVPFSAGHATIKDLTFDICKYRVLVDQDVKKAVALYKMIEDRAKRLVAGHEHIITDSGTLAPSGGATEIWSNTKDYHPIHTVLDEDSPYTMIDSSQLYDLENERD